MPELIHHEGLSNEDYHHLKAVSPSQIKILKRSPLHYYDQFLAEDRVKKPPTDAMLKGTALHTAILEPELWDTTIAVPPHSFDRRTRVGKELAAEFERESAGKIVLSPEDADEVRRMADAVRKHPAAGFLLELPGRREASYTWTDPETGLECKTRPDWHSLDGQIVVDVKTAQDASREAFAKSWPGYGDQIQEPIDLPGWNRD
ncbi:MAG: hypothetical protein EBR82_63635 [Caulobacteraceae bacterium]|nr:hypothetical protein [Caulobacteraceae bacterium]